MRYYKFSAAERNLVMAEAERPEPGPGQIRVRVAAASLNYRDVYMVSRFGDVVIDNRIPLSDASGTVDGLGTEQRASDLGTDSQRYSFRIGSQVGSGPATHTPHSAAKALTACCPNT
jgi:NADPH:quinone reductase-like Zn-dependent oxidoreductase